VSACIDYVHFDDYLHCYCQIIEDYRRITKMSYRLHRKKKKSWGISAWFGILEKKNYIFVFFGILMLKKKIYIILIYF
jgi:hypothetical protein